MKTIASNNSLAPSEILQVAKTQLESHGYWIFSTDNTQRSFLLELADCFGQRQGHAKSDPDGVREVKGKAYASPSGSVEEQYVANTTEEFTPHTDGSFLDGIAKTKAGKLVSVNPPKIVLMQMVQPALSGGGNTLLDSQEILEDALLSDPEMVSILMQPYFIYSRDDQCARTAVISCIAPQVWSIRWRYDFATLVTAEACEVLQFFHRQYISNPKYLKYCPLAAGDILVVDNQRVLHGREAFVDDQSKPRLLRRLWVGDRDQVFISPLGRSQDQKVYAQYQPYSHVGETVTVPKIEVSTGIKLTPKSQAIAEKLFSRFSTH